MRLTPIFRSLFALLLISAGLSGRLTAQGFITGVLFIDTDTLDCAPGFFEQRVPGVVVEVRGPTGAYYGVSGDDGQFAIAVPFGGYTLDVGLDDAYWERCPGATATVSATDTADFVPVGIRPAADCPRLEVDLAADRLLPCDTATLALRYRNTGPSTADSVFVLLELPDSVYYAESSIPLSAQNGQVLRFELPALERLAGGTFTVRYVVDCDPGDGYTRCFEARIFPSAPCFPPLPSWDGARIEVEAGCLPDSTMFLVRNVGTGAMATALPFIIAEDQIMYRQGWFQLGPGADTLLVDPSGAATRVLLTRQTTGFPGLDRPVAAADGCGAAPTPDVVNRYPQNEADPFVAVHCLEPAAGAESNTADGLPRGIGPQHRIPRGQDIDYLLRIQNTTAVTATHLSARFELPPGIDPLTVQPGAASHPYTFTVARNQFGPVEVRFEFPGIELTPAAANDAASRAYVQFRAGQQPDLPDGTVLEAFPELVFNGYLVVEPAPVMHTIGEENWLALLASPAFNAGAAHPEIQISPHPVSEQATLVRPGWEGLSLELVIYDLQGRRVGSTFTGEGRIVLRRDTLPAGVYAFRLLTGDGQWVAGKLMVR